MGNQQKDILYLRRNSEMYRRLYFTGIFAYVVMLVLSLLFYKERSILLDSSFDLFYLLKDGGFDINVVRFSGVLSKVAPVLAIRAGLPLNEVLLCYSFGYAAYYFLCYFICGTILKKYDFALVILLCNILFVAETFYYIPSELPQGIAFALVVFAFVGGRNINSALGWVALTVLCIVCAFFHPLLLFVIAYTFVFFLLQKDRYFDVKQLSAITILFFVFVALKTVFIKAPYEQHAMGGLKNFVTQFPNYFTLYSDKLFLYNCITKYYWIPIFAVTIITLYRTNREWRKLAFFVLSVAGYLFLVNVCYPTKATPTFYIENLYLPIGVFLALPLVFDVLPFLEKKRLAFPVFVLILLTGCVRLYATHSVFTERLNLERDVIAKYNNKKVVIGSENVDADLLQMLWGTPYEFLLLGESENNKAASIIIDDKPRLREPACYITNALVVNWNVFPYCDLPTKYFHFTDTTSGYVIVP